MYNCAGDVRQIIEIYFLEQKRLFFDYKDRKWMYRVFLSSGRRVK